MVIQLGIALQQANTYAQLAQSEARYRTIIEDQTELIIRHSPDRTIQFVNSAYCRYFGLQPEAIVGKSYQPIIFTDDREQSPNRLTPSVPQTPQRRSNTEW